MLKPLIIVASLAVSTSALAAPTHLTDAQYMEAARCRALIASSALGKGDTHVIDALMKREGAGRIGMVYDRADEMGRDAARLARDANGAQKASLVAERDGACLAFNAAPGETMTSISRPAATN
ncbi:MAG: hypothetical protein ACYC8V_08680 [Caulobacteraceae bacterium]